MIWEIRPYHDNKASSIRTKRISPVSDTYIRCDTPRQRAEMRKDMADDAAEMLNAGGFKNIQTYDRETGIGLGIHEMGTARMGKDPKTSVLNKWNQVHACKNVFVTDGSFMASAGCQNPSLGYMAFTARAVDHAVNEIRKINLNDYFYGS